MFILKKDLINHRGTYPIDFISKSMSKCTLKAESQKTLKYGNMGDVEVYIDDKLFILPTSGRATEARGSVLALSASYRGRLLNPGVVTRGRAMSESLYICLTRQALLGPFWTPPGVTKEAIMSESN